MPKAAVLQSGFSTGEVSPLFYGSVENPRYKKGLETGVNYIPTLQGPMIRRPGTKYVANVKSSTHPPIIVPFKFSATQNYILEFGDLYVRFYTNNGQVVTSGTTYKIAGTNPNALFWAIRDSTTPLNGEIISSTTMVSDGAIMEMVTPYHISDVPNLRFCQKGDTIYITHSNYRVYKMQRQSSSNWVMYPVYFIDGPYLPANSFSSIGDNVATKLIPVDTSTPYAHVIVVDVGGGIAGAITDPALTGQIQITTNSAHGLLSGQKVFIYGVVGTTEANNYSTYGGRTSSNTPYWSITVTSDTTFLLIGSTFVNGYSSAGKVTPALFYLSAINAQLNDVAFPVQDLGRSLALVITGVRYWCYITIVYDAATVRVFMGNFANGAAIPFPGTTQATAWYLQTWSGSLNTTGLNFQGLGHPAVAAFHQDRLVFAGAPNNPQDINGSNVGLYEVFAPSLATSLVVSDSDSYSFSLSSPDQNPLRWLASTAQGLLSASYTNEWAITPSGSSEALTPTNFNAQETSFYGAAQIAPVKIGNAVLYIQRSARKLREMAFFFMGGTFRSSDITEISEHITLPSVTKIDVQKENQPLVWCIRSDGVLTSMVYNRDDLSLSVGWMRHILGGQSDSAGTPPVVYDIAFIPDPLVSFDQMWLVVKRWLNGSLVYTVEYMTKISDSSIIQEDSFQGDCGAVFDNPKIVAGISIANPCVVSSVAHGFSNGDTIKITDVVGLNLSTTDINGNITVTNLVNEKTFVVASAATDSFALHDFSGNAINSTGYSAWVAAGGIDGVHSGYIRKLVTTITGLTWLENETVGVLADGGTHPDCLVSNGGAITLQFPAAKVQIGYRYKSQGKLLRAEAGAADGTSLGATRRTTRAALQLYRCGDMSIGTSFTNLIPIQFSQIDQNQADVAVPLFSGIVREGVESAYDFESQLCFEQSSMLPGTIQSITTFMEEQDV